MRYEGITRVLDIPGFFARDVRVSEGRVDIRLERKERRFRCGRCGQVWSVPHDEYEVCVQDLRMTGRVVYLHFLKGRVRCCGKEPEVEHLGWVGKNDRQTIRLKWAIYEECKQMSVSAVAGRHRLSWGTVKEIDKEMIDGRLKDRDLSGLRRLAIDEVSLTKGQRYLTVVTDLDERRVVWVGRGRKSKNLNEFLLKLPESARAKVDVVVIDMWEAYRKSVGKYLPKADIVFDKYHVMEHLNQAIDEVRKSEAGALSEDERKALKGKRWVLLKGAENLSPEEQGTLGELLKANETLHKAYLLKEEFREFYRLDFAWHWKRGLVGRILELARNYLRGWMKRAMESALEPLKKFCKMLRRREAGVVGYFVKRVTLGVSEGINNKIKAVKKRAYGYRDPEYFILKIYQACGRI